MKFKLIRAILFLAFSLLVTRASKLPSIIQQPPRTIYFVPNEAVKLPCIATGEPTVSYRWMVNGDPIHPIGNERVHTVSGEGSIIIDAAENKDEGFYQCFATNRYGTAMTTTIKLKQARLDSLPDAPPKYIRSSLGESLTLHCHPPTTLPSAQIRWILRNANGEFEAILLDAHRSIDYEGNLHFTGLKLDDFYKDKSYACMASNAFLRRISIGTPHYILLVPTTPAPTDIIPVVLVSVMWTSPRHVLGIAGGEVGMKCIFAGTSTPRVYWERLDGDLPVNRSQIQSFGMEIVITNLRKEDEGIYQCQGINDYSTIPINLNFTLSVKSPPSWISPPKDIEAGESENVTLVFEATGQLPMKLDLFTNGRPFSEQHNPSGRIVTQGLDRNTIYANVMFYNLSMTDTQVIQCNISNAYGYIFTNSYLNVNAEPPHFEHSPSSEVKVAEGHPVNLSCQASGWPRPVVTWFKGDQPIKDSRHMTIDNGHLLIPSVVRPYSGQYTCRADNKFGYDFRGITLLVTEPTRIVHGPSGLDIIKGQDATFTCSAITDQTEVENLRIYWEMKGKRVDSDDQRIVFRQRDNTLVVHEAQIFDSGRFTCIATNGIDTATSSAMLTVRGPPDPPNDVRLEICKWDSAIVGWGPANDNNDDILEYLVEFNTTFSPEVWTVSQRLQVTGGAIDVQENYTQLSESLSTVHYPYNVKIPLSPWANFTFRVRAANKVGVGEPSVHTAGFCRTPEDVPYNNPSNVHTVGDKKGYLVIEWDEMPPIDHNAVGFVYLVLFKPLGSGESFWRTYTIQDYKQTRLEVALMDRFPNQPYEIMVKAHNSRGDARARTATIIGHSGEAEPDIVPLGLTLVTDPERAVTNTTATLEWYPVPQDETTLSHIHGEFRGYRIQYWRKGLKRETFQEQIVPRGSSTNSCANDTICVQLKNLPPYTDINAQVVVMNNFYTGPPSPIIYIRTLEGAPGPVSEIRSTGISSHINVSLSWLPPSERDQNGVILGYDVTYQTVDGTKLGPLHHLDPPIRNENVTETTISGLRANQTYRIHVRARTNHGPGGDNFMDVKTPTMI